jgi:hypothetical protein
MTLFNAVGSWKLEITSLVLAFGLLAAIFVALSIFDGQNVPSWPVRLNINSLVAIFATLLRVLPLFPLAQVISQEKWLWFQRPRPLRHLDDFDLGSRGI